MSVLLSVAVPITTLEPAVFQLFKAKPGTTDLPPLAQETSRVAAAVNPAAVDQVQVSKQSEALLLYSQGQSIADIEATLGLPETLVTSYLGITDGTQTVLSAATAAVETQQGTPAA